VESGDVHAFTVAPAGLLVEWWNAPYTARCEPSRLPPPALVKNAVRLSYLRTTGKSREVKAKPIVERLEDPSQ
jgi:hypothetical protein